MPAPTSSTSGYKSHSVFTPLKAFTILMMILVAVVEQASSSPFWSQKLDGERRVHDARAPADDVTSGHVTVRVSPKRQTRYMYDKKAIVVECTAATSGDEVEDLPFINFYWLPKGNDRISLSSSMPGVTIQSEDGGRDENSRILFLQRLIIDSPMYDILRRGEHRFSCGAVTVERSRDEDTFFVRKR